MVDAGFTQIILGVRGSKFKIKDSKYDNKCKFLFLFLLYIYIIIIIIKYIWQ
jgi:hypothetical protein